MTETLVAGIDSSTQSTKVLLVRANDGTVVDQASAPHPAGTEVDPEAWWEALQIAGRRILDRAAAIGVAGQQHGMIALDRDGAVVRDALLWNDLRSAGQINEVVQHLGGAQACANTIGSVPPAAFTVTKLRWMHHHEPVNADRTAAVLLPHDWLTWRLGGRGHYTTDHGDASGTGYYSPAGRHWLPEVAAWALGRNQPPVLPRLAGPSEIVGRTSSGALLSAGTGDNVGAAMGLSLQPGDIVVSIGTSGTAFGISEKPIGDPTGTVSGLADASGRYLPLVCSINASRVLSTTEALLGVNHEAFAELAMTSPAGADGLTMLPYLDGERTPNRPDATGVIRGITSATSRDNLACAAVEALLCSLADAVDALTIPAHRVLMIGGGARNAAVQQIAPSIFGRPIEVPAVAEYVALGAARQAAWALTRTDEPPTWNTESGQTFTADPTPSVRQQYAALRDDTAPPN
jgi:xylulokinase